MQKKSFTLVELMIVIAILAILSAIVIFALNPARLFDNFRDSKRVTDISSINKAIVFMESWNQSGITYGTTTNVYISLPDSSSTCSSYSLPTLPTGYTYYCSNATNYKNTDGTGWIPINFTVEGSNRYLSSLPVDPVNNSSFFYTYYSGGSYELTAILSNPNKNSINDEGSLTSTFEIGSPNRTWNTPLQRDKGLVGYWDFNETSGTIAYDKSGNGYNGTLTNGPVSTTTAYGERNLYFDGINDFISTPAFSIPNNSGIISISAWINCTSQSYFQTIFADYVSSLAEAHLYFSRHQQASNSLSFRYGTGSDFNYIYSGGNNYFTGYDNQWVFITVVSDYNLKNIKYYRNGVLFSNNTASSTMLFPNILRAKTIGGWSSANAINGYLDNFRLYSRSLSVEEIQTIYNQEKSHYGL